MAATRTAAYTIIDVFTTERFTGNPLAIVSMPADNVFSQEQKHQITKEFNLSETVFIHSSDTHEHQIDIFTPGSELPFAGHPTIGSAWWLDQAYPGLEKLTLRTKAGPIPVAFDRDNDFETCQATASIPHDVRVHQSCLQLEDLRRMQPGLQAQMLSSKEFPVVSIVNGMTFALIQLDSKEALSKVGPASKLTPRDFVSLDSGWTSTFIGSYFYIVDKVSNTPAGVSMKISCRMIEGLLEDPATGSAASALASYLALKHEKAQEGIHEFSLQLEQGVAMGRRSVINLRVVVRDGIIQSVHLSGTAVEVMSGQLCY